MRATCHGAGNRAMVDACMRSGGTTRGVATVRRSMFDAELQALHAADVRVVRGVRVVRVVRDVRCVRRVRFNFVRRLMNLTPERRVVGNRSACGGTGLAHRHSF